jgi:hypothetical protein
MATMKKANNGLTYTTPRGKKYSLPQGASGPLNITRPNGSTRTIENREKYTKKMQRVFDRNTVDGVRQGTMEREKNGGMIKKAQKGKKLPLGASSAKAEDDYRKSDSIRKSLPQSGLKIMRYLEKNGKGSYQKALKTADSLSTAADNRTKQTGGVRKGLRFKNGGSLSALNASNKRDNGIDPKGAFTKVQKKTLAGAKGKASLTKDKQLGATKMAKRGMSIKKK